MSNTIHSASKLIHAPASTVYAAFGNPAALQAWLPPTGMAGTMLAFDFREGGLLRMRLTYKELDHTPGKTTGDADEFEARYVRLVRDRRVEQAVTFSSEDPAYAGEMRMIWTLEEAPRGTRVTVRCENVPPGIGKADHETGLNSTLGNLAAFTGQPGRQA